MEQHPVPQNISSYQFHLVGDMTLKQFLELAGGVVVGILFYATGLPGIIKWPLILISSGIGAALAFVPLEERPLEQWFLAFIRSVYSPTMFHWEKRQDVKYFADENQTGNQTGLMNQTPTTKIKTNPFSSIPFLNKLEDSENSYLSRLTGLFNPGTPSSAKATGGQASQLFQPAFATSPVAPILSGEKKIDIPQTTFISVNSQTVSQRPQVVVQEIQSPPAKDVIDEVKITPIATQQVTATAQAKFSQDAAPPSMPTIPNTISGQVMTSDKKIVEGAVLEILDKEGRPVRALRTNRAGHFLNVTPLMEGTYKIVIEKEGLDFEPLEFETKNAIIEPIAITAK